MPNLDVFLRSHKHDMKQFPRQEALILQLDARVFSSAIFEHFLGIQ